MYILQISPRAFIKQGQDGEIIITVDFTKATTFNKFGDAMRVAAQLNIDFENPIVKVIRLA